MTSKIFISYSHKDPDEMERVMLQLGVLQKAGLCDIWADTRIPAGADWLGHITSALEDCDVAVLLISAAFLNSDFILRSEVPSLLDRRKAAGIHVFPIVIKPCAWQAVPWLAAQQVRKMPDGAERLTDGALAAITLEINRALQPSAVASVNSEQAIRQTQVAAKGLTRVTELADNHSEVSGLMRNFTTSFARAKQQIAVVTAYKKLHDVLHRFQEECFDTLSAEVRNLKRPEREAEARRNIRKHLVRMQGFIAKLRDVAAGGHFPNADVSWIERLEDARKAMAEAPIGDVQAIYDANAEIVDIMFEQPGRLNNFLVARSRDVNLDALDEPLKYVRKWLEDNPDVPTRQPGLSSTIAALDGTRDALTRCVDDHDVWQRVEVKIRLAERAIEDGSAEAVPSWRKIKQMTEPLYSGRTDEWARDLLVSASAVEKASAEKDLDAARDSFIEFSERARFRFLRADTELIEFCGYLHNLEEPLGSLLHSLKTN